jgi:hypothetical protein
MESEASNPAGAQMQRVLSAMRSMLIVVSLAAITAIGITAWLYITKIPQIGRQQKEIATKNAEISRMRSQLAQSCVKLATLENSKQNEDESVETLNSCMTFFPNDPTLPAFKAQVMVSGFARNHAKGKNLDYALQAAKASLDIANSAKVQPAPEAYDWKGLTYCLKAKFGQPSDQAVFIQDAINTFQEEFRQIPKRKDSIHDMKEFQDFCPDEVKTALHM